jgi:DNA-binding GntR family transcriptional regulator
MALISACDSNILLRLCSQLFDQNNRYRNLIPGLETDPRNILEEHEQIAQAALRRDPDEATRLLVEHYRRTGRQISQSLRAGARSA